MNCLMISTDNVVSIYKATDLKDLQTAVNGDVEYIALPYCNMIVNKEFRTAQEQYNSLASIILATMLGWMNPIKGNALLVGPLDDKGITMPFTDDLRAKMFDNFPVLKGRYIA